MARAFSAGNNLNLAAALVAAVPLTLACWFNPANTTGAGVLVDVTDGTVSNRFGLIKSGSATLLGQTAAGGSSNQATTTTNYVAGSWQHACAVFAGATDRRVFLNGGGKGTNTTNRVPTALNKTSIGVSGAGTVSYVGDAAEVAAWNVALSDADVALLATGVRPIYVQRANLIAYWPIFGVASPEPDIIGVSQDMALTGTPAAAAHPAIAYLSRINQYRHRRAA